MTELRIAKMGDGGVLREIDACWQGGRLVGLIGPNGAGKSTLLRVLAGIRKPAEGDALLNGRRISSLAGSRRARELAYLPQQVPDHVRFTVKEFVEMGRYAYRGAWGGLSRDCRERVASVLRRTDLQARADAPLTELSGGERQRAAIARCLAQDSPVLLLDEPIASLDLHYQLTILAMLRELAKEGYLIVLVIHDLELAAAYCDELLLLHRGTARAAGLPEAVLTEPVIREVFQVRMNIFFDPFGGHLRLSHGCGKRDVRDLANRDLDNKEGIR